MDRMNTDIAQTQTMSLMPSIPLGTLAEFDHTPRVRIVFGPGASMRAGQLARDLGGRRVLLVTDPGIVAAGHAGADGSGFGTHFRVRIASPQFAGKTPVARHRLVYDALRDYIERGLHALAIETL